ncbi:TPA: DUF1272 domain-containing protein [Klebsiella pneumoniae]|nr:DUF1272 domain-containing protein [Klebsiella pneumoniae]MBU0220477.1 DUF1272 domain-containing protein [Klebsiella pneumoniae]MCQ8463528.1 DUF1272 domain-containing protein [Klebsiella pneumoniae]POI39626.1 DUF1272 domain-containing protein [Klebsiella pneumoniae]HBQ8546806.1 DUF1272 domain-containing protein [Klebsiella pneumoniae]
MLELRPNCECCDKDLPPDSPEAFICSFECTFCRDCMTTRLNGHCPNCGGELVRRPVRPEEALRRHPPPPCAAMHSRRDAGLPAKIKIHARGERGA